MMRFHYLLDEFLYPRASEIRNTVDNVARMIRGRDTLGTKVAGKVTARAAATIPRESLIGAATPTAPPGTASPLLKAKPRFRILCNSASSLLGSVMVFLVSFFKGFRLKRLFRSSSSMKARRTFPPAP